MLMRIVLGKKNSEFLFLLNKVCELPACRFTSTDLATCTFCAGDQQFDRFFDEATASPFKSVRARLNLVLRPCLNVSLPLSLVIAPQG